MPGRVSHSVPSTTVTACSSTPAYISNTDLQSETKIKAALDVLLENRTAILIAHRLSTAMRADRIVVVDDGRIVEVGSHDELVARDGRYAEMHATWVLHTVCSTLGPDPGWSSRRTNGRRESPPSLASLRTAGRWVL